MKDIIKHNSIIILFILSLMCLLACSRNKKFTNGEITITLSNQYATSSVEKADWCYESPNAIVTGVKESKESLEKVGMEDVDSISAYAEGIVKEKGLKSSDIKVGNGYLYFDSTKKISGSVYSYRTCIYSATDGYWVVSFACYKELFESQVKNFTAYADSVVIQ